MPCARRNAGRILQFQFYIFHCPTEEGFSLIEVMVAMVVLAFALLGAMALAQWAVLGAREGTMGTRALALAESRLEAKRTVPWTALLADDLDGDGRAEVSLHDDGVAPDREGGDGIYSAAAQVGGVLLVWTVQMEPPGPLSRAGSVAIEATASFPVGHGRRKSVRVATVRANPAYVGE